MATVIEESSRARPQHVKDDHAISKLARQCVSSFMHTTTVANENAEVATRVTTLFRQRAGTKPILTLDDIRDDYEQFRVWSRNLGVFAHDHGSLDFRLSTADDVRDGITSLLRSLKIDLKICADLLGEDRPALAEQAQSSSDSSSSSSCGTTDVEDTVGHLLQSTAREIQIRFRRISGIIDKLFRLAEAIRASGIRKRTAKAAGYIHIQDGVNLTEQFEMNYLPKFLRHRFKLESPLLERFVKAVSFRRTRFMSQARHQKPLAYGGDFPAISTPGGRPRMLSKSGSECHILREDRSTTHHALLAPSDIYPPTKATTFENLPPRKLALSRIVSGTTKSDINGTEVPPPPAVTDRATSFQCPYCCVLVPKEKRSPRLWKDHLIGDLQPFICLEPDCLTPDAIFESQAEWVEHQKWEHAMRWWCDQEKPPLEFYTAEEYGRHLTISHNSADSLCPIEKQILTAGRPSITPFSCCPLCDFRPEDTGLVDPNSTHDKLTTAILSQKQLQSHIADELLAIFLIALPDREDLQDVKTGTDQPVSWNDTVLALSEVSLQFDDDHAAQDRWRETSPPSVPYKDYGKWNFLWASPQLQDGVRETYEGMRYDRILISMSAHQDVKKSASPKIQPYETQGQSLTAIQTQRCLDSLRNHRLDTSIDVIETADADTCEWLLRTPEYIRWNSGVTYAAHPTLLWISGKPGTGKSTLMKSAYIKSLQDVTISATVAYFFNFNNKTLQDPMLLMYQSLTYQIIEQIPRFQKSLDILSPSIVHETSIRWDIRSLKSVLLQMVDSNTTYRIMCYIDAMDMCNGDPFLDAVVFMRDLGERATKNGNRFAFCLASRINFTIGDSYCFWMSLDQHEAVRQDLTTYTIRHLKHKAGRTEVVQKACNNFLWTSLVVKMLNKAYDEGREADALESMLQDLPIDIEGLVFHIFEHYASNDKLESCLRIVKFAQRSLSVNELRSMLHVLDQEAWDDFPANDRDYISKFSGGLLKIHSSLGTVMFVHDSIKDLKQRANQPNIPSLFSASMPPSRGHMFLKHCCEVYIRVAAYKLLAEDYLESNTTWYDRHPFLEYAVSNIFYHCEAALIEDDSLGSELLENLPQLEWVQANNRLGSIRNRKYKPSDSLLYILADQCWPRITRLELDRTIERITTQDRWGLACIEAIKPLNRHALGTLITAFPRRGEEHRWTDDQQIERFNRVIQSSLNSQEDFEGEFLHWAISHRAFTAFDALLQRQPVKTNHRTSDGLTPLLRATEIGLVATVKLLLAQTNIDVNAANTAGLTSLAIAARIGSLEITTLLLRESAVNVNTRDASGRTPLSHAAWEGHIEVVRLLLTHDGIDVDVEDNHQETALIYACERGYAGIIELLKDRSKWPSVSHLQALFFRALRSDDEAAVRLLLRLSGDEIVYAKNSSGQSPLSVAAMNGNTEFVKLLLVYMDRSDRSSRDALIWAATRDAAVEDHLEVLKLLIKRVASISFSGTSALQAAMRYCNSRTAQTLAQHFSLSYDESTNSAGVSS